jgi:hypothetical protein
MPRRAAAFGDGPAGGHEGGEDVDLSGGASLGELAAQPIPNASRLAAANHLSRPSIGIS